MNKTPNDRLSDMIIGDEAEWSLAEAALLIASVEYPDIDVQHHMRRLDELADTVALRAQAFSSELDRVTELNQFLFEDQGFKANADNYYDPRNSYLNQVLERRVGIPCTLSILYMEVGKRLSLGLQGVSFPGRFLVKFPHAQGDIVLDPFSGGVSLGLTELEALLKSSFGDAHGQMPPLGQLLAAVGKKDILVRLLRNLKSIYLHTSQVPKALSMLDLMLLIEPSLVEEWRERGELYQRLECFRPALKNYQHYLDVAAGRGHSDEVRRRINELSRRVLLLH